LTVQVVNQKELQELIDAAPAHQKHYWKMWVNRVRLTHPHIEFDSGPSQFLHRPSSVTGEAGTSITFEEARELADFIYQVTDEDFRD
jgi:hypothetical protein